MSRSSRTSLKNALRGISEISSNYWIIVLVSIWALFTISLLTWWLIFALDQLETIAKLNPLSLHEVKRHRTMLSWEAGTLICCVAIGAFVLIYYIKRELTLLQRVKMFFATFAHEIKTPLASLRLRCEALPEQIQLNQVAEKAVQQIVADTTRLSMRLENSLIFASLEKAELFFENIQLSQLLPELKEEWPDLDIVLKADCKLRADRRSFLVILRNLIQNAVIHGGAKQIKLEPCLVQNGRLRIRLQDDGQGCLSQIKLPPKPFVRSQAANGSGLGLFLTWNLMQRMNGTFKLDQISSGFAVLLDLEGELA